MTQMPGSVDQQMAGHRHVEAVMFRLVLTHQLVLSVLVGPMLCCCTAVWASTPFADAHPGGCCGQPTHSDRDPHQKAPRCPVECHCKAATQLFATGSANQPGTAGQPHPEALTTPVPDCGLDACSPLRVGDAGRRVTHRLPSHLTLLGHLLRC